MGTLSDPDVSFVNTSDNVRLKDRGLVRNNHFCQSLPGDLEGNLRSVPGVGSIPQDVPSALVSFLRTEDPSPTGLFIPPSLPPNKCI